ncbi:HelD family protein [Hathewaya histolytica]|uniref:HelD family protein n=1 Tax=Hathewaya histolytica TaxID=1498 RepID=UPI003B67BC46
MDHIKKDRDKELEKEIELEIEKERLNYVLNVINNEIELAVNKRKGFLGQLLEYRKKFIEEYRNDEDKVIEYFDHERFVTEEAFNLIDKKLKELSTLKESPYFGRIDFREEEYGIEKIYVGKFGLIKEGEFEPVVVDWRAPIASLFYEGKVGSSQYKSPDGEVPVEILGRVQYIIKNSKLLGMFNSDLDVKDDILQMVLSKNSSDKLKDIVMTIQKEQDEIIRESYLKTLVVNGVAGSGKTTIALHRVAYLLYNNRKKLENKILILGPNGIFMDYISNVLPSLGETGVKQDTFWDMTEKLLDLQGKVMNYKEYFERIIKGDSELVDDFILKSSDEYIERLNATIENLEQFKFKPTNVTFRGKDIFKVDEIEELFSKHYKYMPLYKRTEKIRRIIIWRLKDKRDEEVREINKLYDTKRDSLSPEELALNENDLEFQRKNRIRDVIKEFTEVKRSLVWLENEEVVSLYNRFNNYKKLTPEDLAAIMYLKIKLEGYKIKEDIKHVVIDEAQDLSMLQLRVIKEITGASAFTILGDSNQRILPLKGNIAMKNLDNIYKDLDIKYFSLDKSYRSTVEIMEYANTFLDEEKIVPLVRNGEEVWQRDVASDDVIQKCVVDRILRYKESGYESIAIICEDINTCSKVHNLIKDKVHSRLLDSDELIYKSGVVIIPSYFARGLEFDGVVLLMKDEKEESNYVNKGKLKYIMATRALHKLSVIKIK